MPVVLCYLQGQSNAEAARRLGCSRGTIATLLARAREKLRRRLTQRGVSLSVGAVLAGLVETARGAAVPWSLEQVTVKAAALLAAGQTSALGALAASAVALAKGVSQGMLMEKLKIPAAILMMTAVVGAGAGVTAYRVRAQESGAAETETEAKPQPAKTERAHPHATPPAEQPKDQKIEIRTENFAVTAPTEAIAQQVARIAERHRKELALLWLGKELPTWNKPCPVRVIVTDKTTNSYSTFQFREGMMVVGMVPIPAVVWIKPKVIRGGMVLEGPLDSILADLLPHEITHTILAEWRGQLLPRWADEGAATLSERAASRAHYEQAMAKFLRLKHFLPLRDLLPEHDYPKEIILFYAQSLSLTDFLISTGGRKKFLMFVEQGESNNWNKAARSVYGYETVKEMEQAWLTYARKRLGDKPSDESAREAPARAQAGPIKIEASAKGVTVEVGGVQASAQRVVYDEAKGRLELMGSDEVLAILFKKWPGQREQRFRARKIIYFLKDGKIEVPDLGSASEP